MNRPSARALAVAAGFFGVSMIVAGTANGMADSPAATPLATAVQLHQEDPASVTPAVVADSVPTDTAAEAAPPVEIGPIEVGAGAIECTDLGECDGARPEAAVADTPLVEAPASEPATARPSGPATAPAREPAPTRNAERACDALETPPRPAAGMHRDEWTRAVERWAAQWRAAAHDCSWGREEWQEMLGGHARALDEQHSRWAERGSEWADRYGRRGMDRSG